LQNIGDLADISSCELK